MQIVQEIKSVAPMTDAQNFSLTLLPEWSELRPHVRGWTVAVGDQAVLFTETPCLSLDMSRLCNYEGESGGPICPSCGGPRQKQLYGGQQWQHMR